MVKATRVLWVEVAGPLPQPLRVNANPFNVGYGPDYRAGVPCQGQGKLLDLRSQSPQHVGRSRNRVPRLCAHSNLLRVQQLPDHAHFQTGNVSGQGCPVVRDRYLPGIRVFRVVPSDCPDG